MILLTPEELEKMAYPHKNKLPMHVSVFVNNVQTEVLRKVAEELQKFPLTVPDSQSMTQFEPFYTIPSSFIADLKKEAGL